MNLYLISQTDNINYDTYDSAIVAAKSEKDARKIHPSGNPYIIDHADSNKKPWWETIRNPYETWTDRGLAGVSVKLIGKAVEGTKEGVVLASFNAG